MNVMVSLARPNDAPERTPAPPTRAGRPASLKDLAGLLLVLVLTGCAPSASESEPSPESPAPSVESPTEAALATPINNPAPDFALPLVTGDSLRLSDYRGRAVLVNFWATWCAPCRIEIPDLIALHDAYGPQGFSVIGISEDIDGFDVVQPFAEAEGITYPLVVDDGTVAEAFGGVLAFPTTFLIDPEGRIQHRTIGLFHTERMRPVIESMLPGE